MVRPDLGSNLFGLLFQSTHGAVAQLGERYNGIVEVVGSIPSGSTNNFNGLGIKKELENTLLYPIGISARRFHCPSVAQ